jgi:hypothetical protein
MPGTARHRRPGKMENIAMMDLVYRGVARNSTPRPFTRLVYVYAGFVTRKMSDGQRRSIPVFRRRKIQIAAMRGLQ